MATITKKEVLPKMTLAEILQSFDLFADLLDEEVEDAPDLNAEEMVSWLRRVRHLPAGEEKTAEVKAWCCAMAKGLRLHRLEIVYVQ